MYRTFLPSSSPVHTDKQAQILAYLKSVGTKVDTSCSIQPGDFSDLQDIWE